MNLKLILSCFLLFFISTNLSGCDELIPDELIPEDNFISVTIYCNVNVLYSNNHESSVPSPARDLLVKIEFIKAGGERRSYYEVTDYKGETETTSAPFNLYKEQPITVIANVVHDSKLDQYPDIVFNSDYITIPWDEFYPLHDYGSSASRTVQLTIVGSPTS